ncbi:MAG: hypothetical protein U5J83_06495 [Bryobacterales bacterium]|nr:hypothetical protein [Bryobacterales bacterium]
MRLIALLLALLLCGILPAAIAGQNAERSGNRKARSEQRPRREQTRRTGTIHVPVWIGNGPAEDVDPASFSATLSSAKTRVVAMRNAADPLLLFVAIDFSEALFLTEAAKAALAQAIRSAAPVVYTSLLRIPEQPMVILDPSTDREAFVEALETLPMSGRAGFFEMVDVVAGVTNPVLMGNPVRAAVLYLTDSEIRNYRQDYTNPVINSADSRDLSRRFPDALIREKVSTLTNELLRTSVPVFVVHLNYRNDPLNEAYQTGIKRLAQATGGRSVFCRSIAEIPVAIGDMVNAIQAMGMAQVAVPESVSGTISLTLEHPSGPLEYRSLFDIPK